MIYEKKTKKTQNLKKKIFRLTMLTETETDDCIHAMYQKDDPVGSMINGLSSGHPAPV